jgi:hypothetical protein
MATSCEVLANTKEMFYLESECKSDATKMASYLISQGAVAVPLCFKIGESA